MKKKINITEEERILIDKMLTCITDDIEIIQSVKKGDKIVLFRDEYDNIYTHFKNKNITYLSDKKDIDDMINITENMLYQMSDEDGQVFFLYSLLVIAKLTDLKEYRTNIFDYDKLLEHKDGEDDFIKVTLPMPY